MSLRESRKKKDRMKLCQEILFPKPDRGQEPEAFGGDKNARLALLNCARRAL
jgi:hypothetical protein